MSPHSQLIKLSARAAPPPSLPPPVSPSLARRTRTPTPRHGRRASSGSSSPVVAGVAGRAAAPRSAGDDDARGRRRGLDSDARGRRRGVDSDARGVRLRRRVGGGGGGDQGRGRARGAAAQARGGGVHPGVGRGGGGGPAPGPLRLRAAPRRGRLLRRQGVRRGGHPRHRHGAHPARGVRRARATRQGRRVPVRRPRRHVLRHGHHDGRLRRRGVLPALPLPQGEPRRRRRRRRRRPPRGARRGRGERRRARGPRARAHARHAWPRARPRARPRRTRTRRPARRRRCLASGCLLRRRVHQAQGDFSGSGAGNPGALGDHRRVPGRLAEAVHHQTPCRSSQLPPVLRGHRPWWLHCSGKVQGESDRDHGDLLLTHRPHGHRAGDRHHFQLQQAQCHRPGRRGGLQCSCSRDLDLYVPGRSPSSRFQQPKAANKHEASAGDLHRAFPRCRPHVITRQMGIGSQIHHQRC